jgi:hypothetical protein
MTVFEDLNKRLAWIKEVLTDAEKSPRLSTWEAGFVRNLREGTNRFGIHAELSEKQLDILRQIEAKIYAT